MRTIYWFFGTEMRRMRGLLLTMVVVLCIIVYSWVRLKQGGHLISDVH